MLAATAFAVPLLLMLSCCSQKEYVRKRFDAIAKRLITLRTHLCQQEQRAEQERQAAAAAATAAAGQNHRQPSGAGQGGARKSRKTRPAAGPSS